MIEIVSDYKDVEKVRNVLKGLAAKDQGKINELLYCRQIAKP
jgi:hypothetical protein